jgi:hypothetical protein
MLQASLVTITSFHTAGVRFWLVDLCRDPKSANVAVTGRPNTDASDGCETAIVGLEQGAWDVPVLLDRGVLW